MILYFTGFTILVIITLLIYKLFFTPSFITKHKYIRVETFHKDMTLTITYHKKSKFNKDNLILINPTHIFNFNGYNSLITSENASESINPLDFESKYDTKDYRSAIKSKVIQETFASLKKDSFDTTKFLLILSVLQLCAIGYLLYNLLGKGG